MRRLVVSRPWIFFVDAWYHTILALNKRSPTPLCLPLYSVLCIKITLSVRSSKVSTGRWALVRLVKGHGPGREHGDMFFLEGTGSQSP